MRECCFKGRNWRGVHAATRVGSTPILEFGSSCWCKLVRASFVLEKFDTDLAKKFLPRWNV